MAFKRRRRTTRGRRRGTFKRRKMMRKATRSYVKRSISSSQETKYFSGQVTLTPDTSTGGAKLFNGLIKGVNRYDRIGNKVDVKSIFMNLAMSGNANPDLDGDVGVRIRIMLIIDREADGTEPIASEIFADTTAANYHYSAYNLDYVPSRYKVLKDKSFILQPYQTKPITGTQGPGISGATIKYWRYRYNFRRMITQYGAGNDGTVADIIKNSLYLLCFSDRPTARRPTIGVEWQMRYKDA